MEDVELSGAIKEWNRAHRLLVQNVLKQDYTPCKDSSGLDTSPIGTSPLPAYVPYIGAMYFESSPRIMCFAINQNLSRHTRWTEDWIGKWTKNHVQAIDRLNWAYNQGEALPIRPYAEGFIPLVAAMAWAYYGTPIRRNFPCAIDEMIAVTNFVKFSTTEDASSASIPLSWWHECGERYIRLELDVLKPDLVITFGNRTLMETKRVFPRQVKDIDVVLLPCRFPTRIPSATTVPLSSNESIIWTEHLLPLVNQIRHPLISPYHTWRMTRFPKYFIDVAKCWNLHFP